MTTVALPADKPFVRTHFTVLGYTLMACFAFGLSLMGPMMPFIADKMGLTYTQMGYHFVVQSLGTLLTSLTGDRIARRSGNPRLGWGGAMLMGLALFGVIFGTSLAMTLVFTFLYGVGGGFIILIATATIANANRQHATRAFTEANIGAGTAMIIGPMLVGLIAASALGWQAIAILPLIFVALIAIIFRGTPIPAPPEEAPPELNGSTENTALPRLFWVFGVLMFLGVATEWLLLAWSANFLATVVGFVPGTAAALVSVFAVALVLGRLIGRRLLVKISANRLLILSLLWALLTFPIYWLSTLPALNVVGLFLVGLGVANLGPLTMSGAMTAAGHQTNRASARLGLFPSLANLTMSQLVGFLADGFGIQRAYGVVVVLVIVAVAIALRSNRMRQITD